jgi:hypothetical protein
MSQHPHDKLVSQIIDEYKNKYSSDFSEINKLETEAHYNYYGSRGVADLFVDRTFSGVRQAKLFEVKTAPSDTASEIIRQFKRMNSNFFRDEQRPNKNKYYNSRRTDEFDYEIISFLVFSMNDENIRHLKENRSLYQNLGSSDIRRNIMIFDEQEQQRWWLSSHDEHNFWPADCSHYESNEVSHLPRQLQEEIVDA